MYRMFSFVGTFPAQYFEESHTRNILPTYLKKSVGSKEMASFGVNTL